MTQKECCLQFNHPGLCGTQALSGKLDNFYLYLSVILFAKPLKQLEFLYNKMKYIHTEDIKETEFSMKDEFLILLLNSGCVVIKDFIVLI